jgi:serine/threonine-protein kinase RsbW
MDTAHKLIEEVMGHLDETVWGSKDVFAVNLALEEALVNAVQHGNRLDPDKKVHFICRLNNDKIYVRIEDEGEGFDPNAVPDPTDDDHIMTVSGRGCLLIKGFVSRACWNDTGNVIEFEKDRTTN